SKVALPHGARPSCRWRNSVVVKIRMYMTEWCPYCRRADQLFRTKGVDDIERIRVDLEPERRQEMMELSGRRTVPQIWIGETHVGGYDDLAALDRAGKLDPLLAG